MSYGFLPTRTWMRSFHSSPRFGLGTALTCRPSSKSACAKPRAAAPNSASLSDRYQMFTPNSCCAIKNAVAGYPVHPEIVSKATSECTSPTTSGSSWKLTNSKPWGANTASRCRSLRNCACERVRGARRSSSRSRATRSRSAARFASAARWSASAAASVALAVSVSLAAMRSSAKRSLIPPKKSTPKVPSRARAAPTANEMLETVNPVFAACKFTSSAKIPPGNFSHRSDAVLWVLLP